MPNMQNTWCVILIISELLFTLKVSHNTKHMRSSCMVLNECCLALFTNYDLRLIFQVYRSYQSMQTGILVAHLLLSFLIL